MKLFKSCSVKCSQSLNNCKKKMKVNIFRRRFLPDLSIFKLNNIRQTSSYVQKIREIESLKEHCDTKTLENAKFILFKKYDALFEKQSEIIIENMASNNQKSSQTPELQYISLAFQNYKDLIQLQTPEKIPLDVANSSVLVDVDNNGCAVFAFQLPKMDDGFWESFNGVFIRPEFSTFLATFGHSCLLNRGMSLLRWHRHNAFCACCGNATVRNTAGTQRQCRNCNKIHYPKCDPVAICIITNREKNKCLLVRQPRFPKKMYSAVSGFIELGETLSEAVQREVAEEVGLEVECVQYMSSQSWSLGGTMLMLGCIATVNAEVQIQLDEKELEDARWFSRDEVLDMLKVSSNRDSSFLQFISGSTKASFAVPPVRTIANALLSEWVNCRQNLPCT